MVDYLIEKIINGYNLDETFNEAITVGMRNAINRNGVKYVCPECDLGIPKYKGAYPKCCSQCGAELIPYEPQENK